jgi:hypothetical protein
MTTPLRMVVIQSDPFEIVEVLEYLLRERRQYHDGESHSSACIVPPDDAECFSMVVERAHPRRLVRFLKMHGPELTDDEFRTAMKNVDSKQLAVWLERDSLALTEERKAMIVARIHSEGVDIHPLSVSFNALSIEEAGSSTRYRIHPYKKDMTQLSPAQLRIRISKCDPEMVGAYFEKHFSQLSDAQFAIFVVSIHPRRLALFLHDNYSKLAEQPFRMVMEELDNEEILSFAENHLLKLTDEKRRMTFWMAIVLADFKKLMQILYHTMVDLLLC